MSFGRGSIGEVGEGSGSKDQANAAGFAARIAEKNASKNIKAMKETQKMYKEARQSTPAMEQVGTSFAGIGTALSILSPLMEAFKPILDVVGQLIQALAGAFMAELMPAIKPLIDTLIGLMPFFTQLGTILGQVLAPIMLLFNDILISMAPLIGIIFDLLGPLIEIAFIPLKVILQILAPLLEALAPVFELIGDALEILEPIWDPLILILEVILIGALKVAAFAIAIFIDAITLGFAGAVNFVSKLFNNLNDEMDGDDDAAIGGGVRTGGRLRIGGNRPSFATGTPLITRSGNVRVHAGESIQRSDLVGLNEELLQELVTETRRGNSEKRFRNAFRR